MILESKGQREREQRIGQLILTNGSNDHRYSKKHEKDVCVGMIVDGYWNDVHQTNVYQIDWLKVNEKVLRRLSFSIYYKEWEVDMMIKSLHKYKKSNGLVSARSRRSTAR